MRTSRRLSANCSRIRRSWPLSCFPYRKSPSGRWQSAVAELCLEKERLEGRLAERIGESDTAGKQADWRDVCESLPDGAVLIDFLEYEHRGAADAGTGIEPAAERRLAAFLLRKGGGIVRVEPGPAGPIGQAVEAWRRTCGAPGSGAEAGAELRAKVWMPLAAHLRAGDTVLISPDGCLGRLPFSALPGGRPGSYLLEEHALAVVPVPRILPDLLPVEAATHSRRATGLLLVGDVDYDSLAAPAGGLDPDTLALRRGEELRFTPLPSSRGEILSIRDSFELAFAEGRTTILRRDQASEANFRREVTGHRFAHLATHGFFAPEWAAVTSRPLGGLDSIENGPSGEASPAALYPGLLCGLALAGANSLARGGVDDGLLTAEEVAAMDLAGVDLAVLSACETGLGKAAGGEGLLGLQRAFQMAERANRRWEPWKVNDESTRLLMKLSMPTFGRKGSPRSNRSGKLRSRCCGLGPARDGTGRQATRRTNGHAIALPLGGLCPQRRLPVEPPVDAARVGRSNAAIPQRFE